LIQGNLNNINESISAQIKHESNKLGKTQSNIEQDEIKHLKKNK